MLRNTICMHGKVSPAFLTAFSESSTQIVPQNKKGPENVPDLFT